MLKRSRYSRNIRSHSRGTSRRNGFKRQNDTENGFSQSRLKGNPSQVLDKYLLLAKNALSSGDRIQAEYYYQHADHFSRVMSENNVAFTMEKPDIEKENLIEQKKEDMPSTDSEIELSTSNQDEGLEDEKSIDNVSFLNNPSTKK